MLSKVTFVSLFLIGLHMEFKRETPLSTEAVETGTTHRSSRSLKMFWKQVWMFPSVRNFPRRLSGSLQSCLQQYWTIYFINFLRVCLQPPPPLRLQPPPPLWLQLPHHYDSNHPHHHDCNHIHHYDCNHPTTMTVTTPPLWLQPPPSIRLQPPSPLRPQPPPPLRLQTVPSKSLRIRVVNKN